MSSTPLQLRKAFRQAPVFLHLFSVYSSLLCLFVYSCFFSPSKYIKILIKKENLPDCVPRQKQTPDQKNPGSLSCLFAHTSSFIQTLLLVPEFLICRSPVQPSSTLSRRQVADFTASWDLHPTLKIYFLSAPHYSAFWHAIQVISVNLIIFCSYSRFYRI